MVINKLKIIAKIFLVSIILLCFTSCSLTTDIERIDPIISQSKLMNEKENSIIETTNNIKNHTINKSNVKHRLEERTSWNIELTFLDINEGGFVIQICDYDNQGFYFNPLYFVLEFKENNGWKKLTTMNAEQAYKDVGYVYPKEGSDFVDVNDVCLFSLIPNFKLKNGHYRITKVLSGKEFSTEFEITGQPS